MDLCAEVLLCPGRTELNKWDRLGEEAVLDEWSLHGEFPQSAKLPGSSQNRMDIDRRFMQGENTPLFVWQSVGHGACSERKDPLLEQKCERTREVLFPVPQLPYLCWA